jgi:hypothetical protein
MLRRIREPYGKAGLVVAVVALVAALVGGAYAATGGLTGRQKQEVKKIAKQFAGANGAQGPAGQAGPQGPKGDAGAAGANGKDGENGNDGENGTDGKDGKSVSVFPLSPGNGEGCNETGGAKFTNGTETAFACNGKDGEGGGGGYPETLPTGRTMKGYWEVQGKGALHFGGSAVTTVSFPLPLKTAPTETILIKPTSTIVEKEKCSGEPEAPVATPGVMCLYLSIGEATLAGASASTFGAGFLFGEADEAFGSWAVKAS